MSVSRPRMVPVRELGGRGNHEPGSCVRRYCIHGIGLEVRGGSRRVSETLHRALAHFALPLAGAAGVAKPVLLRATRDVTAVPLPHGQAPGLVHEGIRVWSWNEVVYLACDGHSARLQLAAGTGECVLPAGRPVRKDFVLYALLLLVRRRGLYGLHASAVSRGGTGCLFAGPSGSGKSTQTYSLVRQGWEYLGDDALLLRATAGAVEALALRRDLLLDTHTIAYPELAGREDAAVSSSTGKRRIVIGEIPGTVINRCVPRLLVFPEIAASGRSRIVPLDRTEALARLAMQSAVLTLDREALPRHLHVLGSLVRQSATYRLLAGPDLKACPELAATLLEPVARTVASAAHPQEPHGH